MRFVSVLLVLVIASQCALAGVSLVPSDSNRKVLSRGRTFRKSREFGGPFNHGEVGDNNAVLAESPAGGSPSPLPPLPPVNRTCPHQGRKITIPSRESGNPPPMINPVSLHQNDWIYFKYIPLYDNTCLEFKVYTDVSELSQLVFCNDPNCPSDIRQCDEGLSVKVNKTGQSVVFWHSTVKKDNKGPLPKLTGDLHEGQQEAQGKEQDGYATFAVYSKLPVVQARLFFDGIWQFKCAQERPEKEGHSKSRGVSNGLAAFLFFLGFGLGIAALFAFSKIRREREKAGFVAM